MKRFYLIFETGVHGKTIYPLLEATTIGRDLSNSIPLLDIASSRNHARVRFWQGSWVVEDLGSANGILHNGERVEKATLKAGDSFQVGKTSFSLIEREVAESKDPLQTTLGLLSATLDGVESPGLGDSGQHRRPARLTDVISEIPFFAPLQETEREQLAGAATMHVFDAGEMIIKEGDSTRSIYVLLDGQVRVFTQDQEGHELELADLKTGQFFGEMSFVSGKPRSSSVAALDSTVLIELSYPSMVKVVKENAAVKKVLVEYYKARKQDTQEKQAKMD
jgi:pSer/pThr/pTyr-binding forkhead associated (FHA) protein